MKIHAFVSFHPAVARALSVAVLVLGLATTASAAKPNPGVYPINSRPYGMGLGGWSAEWWKWWLSIPAADHPALGGDCAEAQAAPVHFIASDFIGGGTITCHVPAGRSVLFATANVECSDVEPAPFHGDDEEQRRDCARCWADQIVPASLQVTLDGVSLGSLEAYRAASPDFEFAYPVDDMFGIGDGPGTGRSVSDGYWVFLAPLSAGEHSLSFSGEFFFPTGEECGLGAGEPVSFGYSGSYLLIVGGE